jgi:heterodisulfide reductase subunit C
VPKNFLATAGFIYQTGHGVPNNDANKKLRVKLGLSENPPTTHAYPEYILGIQKILDATGLMAIKAVVEGGKK